MKYVQRLFWAAAGLLMLAVMGIATAPKVRAAIRAAFVEVVLPSQPFSDRLVLNTGAAAIGPETGTLGVSSLTITNFSSTQQSVLVFAPFLSGSGGCRQETVTGGSLLSFYVFVRPAETVHLSFPTPLVFPGVGGHTCIAAQAGPQVEVFVNGFVN